MQMPNPVLSALVLGGLTWADISYDPQATAPRKICLQPESKTHPQLSDVLLYTTKYIPTNFLQAQILKEALQRPSHAY